MARQPSDRAATPEVTIESLQIEARDGFPLAGALIRPQTGAEPRHVVVILPAMGVSYRYYASFASFVATRGCDVVVFDYRGICDSRPSSGLRGFRADLQDWAREDIAGVIDWARRRYPATPLAAVAHSVGGQLLGLAPNVEEFPAILALGSQSGYWRHWSGLWKLRVFVLWHLAIPLLTPLFGYFPSRLFGLGRNIPAGVAQEWAYWGRHPDYVVGRVTDEDRRRYEEYSGRIRALTAIDDTIAPPASARAFLRFFPGATTEYAELRAADFGVRSIGHFGYFRSGIGERLWSREVAWLLGGPSPSSSSYDRAGP